VTVAILGAVARKQVKEQVKVYERRVYFQMLRPVALSNCELDRFGEPNDGGYLMCGNLLGGVQSGYSYGISGYDGWGCDISTKLSVPVHQYDCFDRTVPECPRGVTKFHAECIGDKTETVKGRVFDTVRNQFATNGDNSKRIVLKMDVEGAEWDSLLSAPDEVFEQIDQLVVEFHGVGSRNGPQEKHGVVQRLRRFRVVQLLRRFFEVGHIHFNNNTCTDGLEPFPSWAYEVLFVSKQLARVDPSRRAVGLHPLDAPNIPSRVDCQSRTP